MKQYEMCEFQGHITSAVCVGGVNYRWEFSGLKQKKCEKNALFNAMLNDFLIIFNVKHIIFFHP